MFCWSDSQISLWWIRQVWKDWKVWIENRVQVIRKNVALEYCIYVPTDINPADITTRLLPPNTFVGCELWWKGPDFLQFENIGMPCQSLFRKNRRQRQCCLQVVKKPLALGSDG